MSHLVSILEVCILGVVSIGLWELGRLIYQWWRNKYLRTKAWRLLFGQEPISVILSSERRAIEHPCETTIITKPRETDRNIESGMRRALNNDKKGQARVELDNPASHVLVIGSVRYNEITNRIQQQFALPFQYVDDSFEPAPEKKILKIVSEYGDECSSSVDLKPKRDKTIDYGMLFIAQLPNDKKLCWVGGIHGLGTMGVAKYLLENNEALLADLKNKENQGVSWLFRVQGDYPGKEDFEDVHSVELISEPHFCERRKLNIARPRAVICDLGNVLMSFDHSRTFRAIGHLANRDHKELSDEFKKSTLKAEYERGGLTDIEFYNQFRAKLCLPDSVTYTIFAEYWGDIFWPNLKVIEALRSLKSSTILVMASETNGLHFERIKEHYPEIIDLFDGNLVLSYREKLSKKDPQFYLQAISKAGAGISPGECVYIDDLPDYVRSAEKNGMHGITFQNYPQFVFQMRTLGLYIA